MALPNIFDMDKKYIKRIIATFFILLAIPATVYLSRQILKPSVKAEVDPIEVFIEPANTPVTENRSYRVLIDTNNYEIVYAQITIKFASNSAEITNITSSNQLNETVNITHQTQGVFSSFTVTLVSIPDQQVPTGTYELFNFVASPTTGGTTTNLAVDIYKSQVVDINKISHPVTATNPDNIILTSTPTSTSTITPTSTNTPTPTPQQTGETIILNSATSKSCSQMCQDIGKSCITVGTDDQAENKYVITWIKTRETCYRNNFSSQPNSYLCDLTMPYRGETCFGHLVNWTNCRCE